jgi:hypothetical protein
MFGGLAAGIGLAFLLNLLRPVFFGWHTLGKMIDAPVIGCVSLFGGESGDALARRRDYASFGALGALFIVFLGLIIWSARGAKLFESLS